MSRQTRRRTSDIAALLFLSIVVVPLSAAEGSVLDTDADVQISYEFLNKAAIQQVVVRPAKCAENKQHLQDSLDSIAALCPNALRYKKSSVSRLNEGVFAQLSFVRAGLLRK